MGISIWGKKGLIGPSCSFNFYDISQLHSICIIVITPVLIFILLSIILIYSSKIISLGFVSDHVVELIWSILPIVILCIIGVFSLGSMYVTVNNLSHDYNNEVMRCQILTLTKILARAIIFLAPFILGLVI